MKSTLTYKLPNDTISDLIVSKTINSKTSNDTLLRKITIQGHPYNLDFISNVKLLILSALITLWQPMLLIMLLILTDTILAYMVVKKSQLNPKKSLRLTWNSSTFRIKTLSKLIGYFMILLCGYFISQYVDKKHTDLIVMAIFSVMGYAEIKSIDEKCMKLWGISFLQNILNLPDIIAGKRNKISKILKNTHKTYNKQSNNKIIKNK